MNIWRCLMGPTIADRILALDTMVINIIGILNKPILQYLGKL